MIRLTKNWLQRAVLAGTGETARLKYLAEYRRTQFWNLSRLHELQIERLRRLTEHAFRHCPFYRQRWNEAGISPAQLQTPADFAVLPILEKVDLQANWAEMIAQNYPQAQLIRNQTGGSTGQPVVFYLDRDRLESRMAATHRHDEWAGLQMGDRRAVVWGAPRDLPQPGFKHRMRRWLMGEQLWLDTSHVAAPQIETFLHEIQKFRPKCLIGYAGGLVLLSRYIRERGITPFTPRSIISSAEVLTPADRQLIERAFGCPVFDRYGSREVAVVASECDQHAGLHIMSEGIFLEVVRHGSSVQGEELGSIVVTDLLNYGMPMIRYRIGDTGQMSVGDCACGRGLPRLQAVAGRVTEFIVGADERLVSGVFLATYVVAQRPSLGQVRLRQERAGHLTYQIRKGPGFDEAADLEYLRRATAEFLGPTATADFQFVQEFPQSASGKLVFSRSTAAHALTANCPAQSDQASGADAKP